MDKSLSQQNWFAKTHPKTKDKKDLSLVMKVHFKGTRGSIPTSPTALEIREKVVAALLAARGKNLRSEGQIREFVEKQLPFRNGSSYGGNTPCVHVETDSEDFLIFDGGSGLRSFGKEIIEQGLKEKTFYCLIM